MAASSIACIVFEHWHPVLESYPRHGSASKFSSEFCCSLKAVAFPRAEPPSTDSHGRSQMVSYILKHSEDNSELASARARVIRDGCRRTTEEQLTLLYAGWPTVYWHSTGCLIKFLCDEGNCGKFWPTCGQREIQYIERRMSKCTYNRVYNLTCVFLYIMRHKDILIRIAKCYTK